MFATVLAIGLAVSNPSDIQQNFQPMYTIPSQSELELKFLELKLPTFEEMLKLWIEQHRQELEIKLEK